MNPTASTVLVDAVNGTKTLAALGDRENSLPDGRR